MRVGNFAGELLVIDFVIVPADPLLRHARGAASLEDVEWLPSVSRRHPDFRLQIPQPFVLEVGEAKQIGKPLDCILRVPPRALRPIQPELATGFRREMPMDDLAHVGIQLSLGCSH